MALEPIKDSEQEPSVLNYLDYREFLQTWFRWKKTQNSRYSGALFAKKAGLNSHTLLGMVIRGQRNLGYTALHGFIKALELRGKRAKYFERLVYYNQAKSSDEKEHHFSEIVSLNRNNANNELKTLSNFSIYLSSWYLVAIRELVCLGDFKPDPQWMSDRLKSQITKKQAETAWQVITELELVKWNESNSRYEICDDALDLEPGKIDFVVRNFHKQFLERTKKSVEEESMEERELSSLTIAVSDEELELIKEKICDLRKDLNLEITNKKSLKKHVVAFNTQLLILTDTNNKRGPNNECKDH